jgi:hypothetical protein
MENAGILVLVSGRRWSKGEAALLLNKYLLIRLLPGIRMSYDFNQYNTSISDTTLAFNMSKKSRT